MTKQTEDQTIEITCIDQVWRAERMMNHSELTWVEALRQVIENDEAEG